MSYINACRSTLKAFNAGKRHGWTDARLKTLCECVREEEGSREGGRRSGGQHRMIESPFGEDLERPPAPKNRGPGRTIDPLGNSGSKPKKQNHHARAKALLLEMHPGAQLEVCEKRVTTYTGAVVPVDFWGFLDICGITVDGYWIGCNVTTKAAMNAHIRDYTDPTNTHGQAKLRVVDLLEGYLTRHGVFYIIGYELVGARWKPTVWTVDQAMLDATKARKRK